MTEEEPEEQAETSSVAVRMLTIYVSFGFVGCNLGKSCIWHLYLEKCLEWHIVLVVFCLVV